MISLNNKVALVTGGSRGIGAACVKLFAEVGANVAFTYNSNKAAAEKLIDKLKNKNKIEKYQMSLESEDDIQQTIDEIYSAFGRLDILVNNAGIWEYGEVDKMSRNSWVRTINLNLTGMFLVTKAVIPIMKKNMFGRIINISSTSGQRGEAFYSHYSASKGGVISFTKSLALELAGFNINVNCVAPGWVKTDMTAEVFEDKEYEEAIRYAIPVRRIAEPEDIAGPVVFLASELANHVNGEILNVNGGSVLCG